MKTYSGGDGGERKENSVRRRKTGSFFFFFVTFIRSPRNKIHDDASATRIIDLLNLKKRTSFAIAYLVWRCNVWKICFGTENKYYKYLERLNRQIVRSSVYFFFRFLPFPSPWQHLILKLTTAKHKLTAGWRVYGRWISNKPQL